MDVRDGCAADAPSTSCPWSGPSDQYRLCHIRMGYCIQPVSLVPGSLLPAGGNWVICLEADPLIRCCAGLIWDDVQDEVVGGRSSLVVHINKFSSLTSVSENYVDRR